MFRLLYESINQSIIFRLDDWFSNEGEISKRQVEGVCSDERLRNAARRNVALVPCMHARQIEHARMDL